MGFICRWGILEVEELEDRCVLSTVATAPTIGPLPPGTTTSLVSPPGQTSNAPPVNGITGLQGNPSTGTPGGLPTGGTTGTTTNGNTSNATPPNFLAGQGAGSFGSGPVSGSAASFNPQSTGFANGESTSPFAVGSGTTAFVGPGAFPAAALVPSPTEPTFAPSGLTPTEIAPGNLVFPTAGGAGTNPVGLTTVPIQGMTNNMSPFMIGQTGYTNSPFMPSNAPMEDLAGPAYTGTGTVESYTTPPQQSPSSYYSELFPQPDYSPVIQSPDASPQPAGLPFTPQLPD